MPTANDISVSKFFDNRDTLFVIPNYQRRYAWGEKQVLDLFYDIHYLENNQNHLLSMTLTIREKEGYPAQISIVDGQQRITTLIILIKVLFDHYNGLEDTKEDILRDIERLLYSDTEDDDKIPKLKLGELDRNDFDKIFYESDIHSESESSKLINAYNCLRDQLTKFNINDVENYWKKLKRNVRIIDYKLEKSTDAYKIFEVTNNRGLPLTKTDIIKNFILGHISTITDKTQKSNRLKNVLSKWQQIVINLEGTKKDDFFRHYFMAKVKKKIPFSKLIDNFKEYYFLNVKEVEYLTEYKRYKNQKNKSNSFDLSDNSNLLYKISIEDFLDEIINGSLLYKQIIKAEFDNYKINREIKDLNKVEAKPSYTYLLHILCNEKLKPNNIVKLIKFLQIFMLRRQISRSPTGELDDFFPKLCSYSTQNFADNISEELESRDLEFFPSDSRFEKGFVEHNFNTVRAKYVLGKIEDHLMPLAEKSIDWDRVHLEHIIPQKIKNSKFGDWVNYLGNDVDGHKTNLNRIGNLTLLKDKLNIDASNNSFKEKKKKYKLSSFQITNKLFKKHSFKIKDIRLRSIELASLAIKIWPKEI